MLGQLTISFGEKILGGWHLILGVVVSFGSSLLLVFLARSSINDYCKDPIPVGKREGHLLGIVAVIFLIITSYLNYLIIRIGYADDETLEFFTLTLPAMQRGWLWWSACDETLTANISALVCRFLPLNFETIKLSALLMRTGGAIFAWLLATELFGKRVGFWCSCIIASSVMYMCAMNTVIKEISTPLVFFACLFFTFRGVRTGNRLFLLAGGLFAGLSCYTYVSRWGMLCALLLWPIITVLLREKTYSLKTARWRLLIWLAACALLATPYLYYHLRYPAASFASRSFQTASSWHRGGLPYLIKDAWLEFLAIVYSGDPWFTSNYDLKPMLWWPWACLFWVGLAIMLYRLRETRVLVPLLLMGTLIGMAGLNFVITPNFKVSRVAMLLSAIPAALAIDFLCTSFLPRNSARRFLQWSPLLLVACSTAYGSLKLKEVMTHPAGWWFRAMSTVALREEFVFAHPEYRFYAVDTFVTDVRPGSTVTHLADLRQVLEAPGDGRDVVFLFQAGRAEWSQKLSFLLKTWQSIYPGGEIEQHTVPVKGGRWPVLVSYRVPASRYWFLPPVDSSMDVAHQSATWWRRAELLNERGMKLEAWRDALRAAHIDTNYYTMADNMLDNQAGKQGRLDILLRGGLWNEARTELQFWSDRFKLTDVEASWLNFLKAHGLEMKVYSTYTAEGSACVARFRQYLPEIRLGQSALMINRLHFAARAEGQIFAPKTGTYRFRETSSLDMPLKILVNGKTVLEFSRQRCDDSAYSPGVFLTRGLHSFVVENCTLNRYEGTPPVPAHVPDPLSYLYGFDVFWKLLWQYEEQEPTLIPPECLYAPGATETPRPRRI